MIPRDALIRMARAAGVPEYDDDDCEDGVRFEAGIDALHRFAALVARHVWSRTPPVMVVKTADLDPALLRDMLAKAPPMPLLPEPVPPDKWRQAIDHELVVAHLGVAAPDADPAALLQSLIQWHVDVALDPDVSERARALVSAEREACATLVEAEDDGTPWCPTRRLAAAIRARGAP